jgi:hypothetical protein
MIHRIEFPGAGRESAPFIVALRAVDRPDFGAVWVNDGTPRVIVDGSNYRRWRNPVQPIGDLDCDLSVVTRNGRVSNWYPMPIFADEYGPAARLVAKILRVDNALVVFSTRDTLLAAECV